MKKLILASHNQHKVDEIMEMIEGTDISIQSLSDIGWYQEIIEDGLTLEANAFIKAKTINQANGLNVFGEDTGLEIEALNGAPGVITARYAGLEKDANNNMAKVLEKMQSMENRNAQFRTCIYLIWDGNEHLFEGIVKGKIALQKSGDGGFGYDPIFIPKGYDKTFAQLPSSVKNKISHRARAIKKLVEFLVSSAN